MSVTPNKYIPVEFSILGVSSLLVESIASNDTVSMLWDRVQKDMRVRTFDRFADALTLLFAAQIIEIRSGIILLVGPRELES
jgi:hypothetical protein